MLTVELPFVVAPCHSYRAIQAQRSEVDPRGIDAGRLLQRECTQKAFAFCGTSSRRRAGSALPLREKSLLSAEPQFLHGLMRLDEHR